MSWINPSRATIAATGYRSHRLIALTSHPAR
jgi:hypothetical protein